MELAGIKAVSERRPQRLRVLFALGTLLVLVFALYAPVLSHGFLNYDDDDYVTANANVQTGLNARSVNWAFTNLDASQYQPVTWITHILDCSAYGLNPAGHHLTNVLFHAANVCMLFLGLWWLTGCYKRSLLVAALFAAHPVNVENVAWIAERKTLVCAFFSFLSIGAYAWYARKPGPWRFAIVMLLFVMAVAAKSMAVTVPLVLLLLDYWPLARWGTQSPDRARVRWYLILEKVPLLVISATISLLTVHAEEKGSAITHSPLTGRVAQATYACAAYLWRLLSPGDLSVLTPFPANGYPAWIVLLAALVLIAITVAVLRLRAHPYLMIGWLFYLVSVAPVSGIIPVGHSVMPDRFLYTPEIGIFIAMGWGVADLLARLRVSNGAKLSLGVAVIVLYASVTALYLPAWKNSYTLFSRAERLSPVPDPLIENNLGQGLVEVGRVAEATPHYRQAVALAPQLPLSHYNLGNNLLATGNPSAAAAEFARTLELSPPDRLREHALNNLGVAQLELGAFTEAERNFTAVLQLHPDSERSLVGRGESRFHLKNYPGAISDLAVAAARSSDPNAYYWLGKSKVAVGDLAAAEEALRECLRLRPAFEPAQEELERIHGAD